MDSHVKGSGRPKARQSIAHLPMNDRTATSRENATTDVSNLQRANSSNAQMSKRNTRGKSIGPGGLEALLETSGNAGKVSSPTKPKSILKPTIPLTPPKAIPTFDELRKKSTSKAKSPASKSAEELLIDFSTPGPTTATVAIDYATGAEAVQDPFSPFPRRSPRNTTSSPMQKRAQAEEGDEEAKQRRKAEREAAMAQRAARRKSMANRRVSFAPEATLHTWSVMELVEDSTTSSASNSTRRQSSMTAQQSPKELTLPASERHGIPSTPIEQIEEPVPTQSPEHQRDLHQRKRRRSSGVNDDVYSSSPSGDVTTDSSPARVVESDSDEDDTDGDTAMSMDEPTCNTVQSQDSSSSTQSSLDERLRQAAHLAGTRGIDYDEHGDDLPMEIAGDTVTHAFQPWAQGRDIQEPDSIQDQEDVNPFSPAFKAQTVQNLNIRDLENDEQDVSMDVTKAIGGIVQGKSSQDKDRRKSVSSRRRSSMRRQSAGGDSSFNEETMDMTVARGGILAQRRKEPSNEDSAFESDEEMTMELTNVVGDALQEQNRRESVQSYISEDNITMDMTAAIGGILGTIEEQTEPQTGTEDDMTAAMDMTRAVGAIIPPQATRVAEEDEKAELASSGQRSKPATPPSTQDRSPQRHRTSTASETGSPSIALKPRLSGRSKQPSAPNSAKARPSPKHATPVKGVTSYSQSTPTKQITPALSKAETPNKTPVAKDVPIVEASARKLFQEEMKAKASPGGSLSAKKPLFSRNEATGAHTPSVVLHAPKPHQHLRRQSSGVGIDKDGVGSPRVTEILSRRTSIGDEVSRFEPSRRPRAVLRFEDPHQMEVELDAERAEDHRRESGRFIMEQEADQNAQENNTVQLKDMIESLSPAKPKSAKLKGRKSLAVGAARGILGKRPAELDLDDDEDVEVTPKRLKAVSREASPVKKVHLPKPPSVEETTGRLNLTEQLHLGIAAAKGTFTPTTARSPMKKTAASSPHAVKRSRDIQPTSQQDRPESFEDKLDNVLGAVDANIVQQLDTEKEEEKISLQDFLNMTGIHFIELSTTKRRHTISREQISQETKADTNSTSTVGQTFVAAATTLPLLELYQHATRELKSYISAGRKIIKSIEAETMTEQPLLFREYVDASPDVKLVMDNQFRNGKINARLQSKEGWYTWRTQLVDGLKGGLEGIRNGMLEDKERLIEQERMLEQVLPDLGQQHESLQQELATLQNSLEDFDSIDYELLNQSRQQLRIADNHFQEKTSLLESLRQQMHERTETLLAAEELKMEMQDQLAEAERVRDEHRRVPAKDVVALKARVNALTKLSGWRLVSGEESSENGSTDFGVALTLLYKSELHLFFYPSAFQSSGNRRSNRKSRSLSGPNAPISLTFSPQIDDDQAVSELSTEKRFFLQLIRSQLHAFSMLPRGTISPQTLIRLVSNGWDDASKVTREVKLLSVAGLTRVDIKGDETLAAVVSLLLPDKSRVDIEVSTTVHTSQEGTLSLSPSVKASPIYGAALSLLSESKLRKVQSALVKEIESKAFGNGAWISAIYGFQEWYTAQGQPTPRPISSPITKPEVKKQGEEQQPSQQGAPTPAAKRSPLAVKRANPATKKALPVATQKLVKEREIPSGGPVQAAAKDKENVPPAQSAAVRKIQELQAAKDLEIAKAAMTPEMQEALMHAAPGTPLKRIGALRRSPL